MQRREFMENAALLTIGLAASATAAAAGNDKSSDASAANPKAGSPLLLKNENAMKMLPHFIAEASACAGSGDMCAQHCEEQLAAGASEFFNCANATNQMAAICGTVAKLAAMKSVRLPEILDVCTNACKACKDACDEHKAHWKHGMHLICKACAEHCEKLIAEITKLKAALAS